MTNAASTVDQATPVGVDRPWEAGVDDRVVGRGVPQVGAAAEQVGLAVEAGERGVDLALDLALAFAIGRAVAVPPVSGGTSTPQRCAVGTIPVVEPPTEAVRPSRNRCSTPSGSVKAASTPLSNCAGTSGSCAGSPRQRRRRRSPGCRSSGRPGRRRTGARRTGRSRRRRAARCCRRRCGPGPSRTPGEHVDRAVRRLERVQRRDQGRVETLALPPFRDRTRVALVDDGVVRLGVADVLVAG